MDYPFRHENVLQEIEGKIRTERKPCPLLVHCFIGDLPGNVFYCQYPVPLPRISPRLVCAVRTWVPEYCTRNGTSGELCRVVIDYCVVLKVTIGQVCLSSQWIILDSPK